MVSGRFCQLFCFRHLMLLRGETNNYSYGSKCGTAAAPKVKIYSLNPIRPVPTELCMILTARGIQQDYYP